jgi:hypothetical protein
MIVPYKPEHLTRILLQPSQAMMQPMMNDPEYAEQLVQAGPAYSLVVGDEVVACAGLMPQWENRAVCWALVGANAGRHFAAIHKAALRMFTLHPYRRIETAVLCGFEQGHRWMRMLGFKKEGTMAYFSPDGGTYDLYAKVHHG